MPIYGRKIYITNYKENKMRFSKLTKTSRLNEGYDITAIKEQITSLLRGKL